VFFQTDPDEEAFGHQAILLFTVAFILLSAPVSAKLGEVHSHLHLILPNRFRSGRFEFRGLEKLLREVHQF
jgi:hypothetical protein